MRDQRAEALAQILVRYSTRVQKGDVCVIQSTTAAEVLVQAVYEEVLRAGGHPIIQLTTTGAAGRLLRAGLGRAARLGVAHREVGRRARRRAHRDHGRRQRARAPARRSGKQARAQKARKPLMETSMQRAAEGDAPLGAHALPHRGLRRRGGHVAARVRGLLLRGVPGRRRRPGHGVGAPVRRGEAGWPSGSTGAARCTSRRPGTDLTLGVEGRTWIPCAGEHNMPDGEFFTGPGRGLGQRRRWRSRSPPGTAAARWRACASGSRTARSWTPPPSAARSS